MPLSTAHYIVLIVIAISVYCTFIFLLDVSANNKRIKTKSKNWRKFTNESSEKHKIETGKNIWKSLSASKENKEKDE